MSVPKRIWTIGKGVTKSAWLVDYVDGRGKRRAKTFDRKEADAFHASATVEVHVADRASITAAAAGKLWIASGEASAYAATADRRGLA